MQKPLPVIVNDDDDESVDVVDESSIVVVKERNRTPSPTSTVTHDSSKLIGVGPSTRRKRRSMSVSDAELKRAMTAAAAYSTPGRRSGEAKRSQDSGGWASAISGMITDFKGDLSQLDLDLRDPSTPARRQAYRAQADKRAASPATDVKRSTSKPQTPAPSERAPSLSLQTSSETEESIGSTVESLPPPSSAIPNPIIPMRTSSLQNSPARTFSSSSGPVRPTGLRYGPRSPPGRSSSGFPPVTSPTRSASRLRAQHRSTASSSEPSLIPNRRDDGRVRE